MKRLAPALRGRITRRTVVHSPYTWNATAAVFAIFAISDAVVAFTGDGVSPERLLPLSACIALAAIAIFATRPPELGSPRAHVLVAAVYCGVAAAVFAHAPQGSAPMITGVYVPVLVALWITERRQIAAHLVAASALLLMAALLGGNDRGTLVAALFFIPTSVLLCICCVAVLDAVDAQGAALDALALRDPLTGLGNRRAFEEELSAELARHRSGGWPLTVLDLSIARFDRVSDHVGPAAADAVIGAVARALVRAAPAGATIARLDGARFAVLLPTGDRAAGDRYVAAVRAVLPSQAGGLPIALLAGAASFPDDGDRRADLTAAASARRGEHDDADAAATVPERPPTRRHARAQPWDVVLGHMEPVEPPAMPARVTRESLAVDRLVWRVIGTAFVGYAVVGVISRQLVHALAGPAILGVAGAAALLGLTALAARPPRLRSARNHVLIAAAYLLPFGAMAAAAPNLSWVIGTAVMTPVLTAVRLTDRRAILGHLLAFTAIAVGLVVSGTSDQPGTVGLVALLADTWVLTVSIMVVFEAAERQSAEILELVLRDPLTGAGNRHLIRQHIAELAPRHRELQLSFSLVELDAVGFDDLLYRAGRGSANARLRELSRAVIEAAGPHATVARVSGSTFRILLPFTEVDDLTPLVEQLRRAVADASTEHHRLGARLGVAEFPTDADDAEGLEAIASARRTADDPERHDLRDALTVLAEIHGGARIADPSR